MNRPTGSRTPDGAERVDRLVTEHLPVARRIARRYAGRGEPLDDLIQVATLGLLTAARRYDETRGVPFVAYAIPMMVGELKLHFRDRCWSVHVPRPAKERALRVSQALRAGDGRREAMPSAAHLAERLSLTEPEVVESLGMWSAYSPTSLDAPVGLGPDQLPLGALVPSRDTGYDGVELRVTLAAALRRLPLVERRIFCLRYLGHLTQCEIAAQVGISQMQVCRVLRRISERLIAAMGSECPGLPSRTAVDAA